MTERIRALAYDRIERHLGAVDQAGMNQIGQRSTQRRLAIFQQEIHYGVCAMRSRSSTRSPTTS